VISSYVLLFTPVNGFCFNEMVDRNNHAVLYDALPPRYIRKMKEANQQPLPMNYTALRKYAINIETTAVNPGV
jgi:hypothetical protein